MGVRVLSLFDGISVGRLALKRASIPVETYYASEIEPNAIKITQYNYPDTIQLGDINNIDFSKFDVDMVIGGFPCTDISVMGNREGLKGKHSSLFFKQIEAIQVIKPKYFLIENNYGMTEKDFETVCKLTGVYPILIDSALVSGQKRLRYYWTNIGAKKAGLLGHLKCCIPQPQDKNIMAEDLIKFKATGNITRTKYLDKGLTILCENLGYCPLIYNSYNSSLIKEKTPTLTTFCGGRTQTASILRFVKGENTSEYYEVRDGKIQIGKGYPISLPDGFYGISGASPEECEQLQTLPIGYTHFGRDGESIQEISKGARFIAVGNCWTADVIAHIFRYMEI